MKNSEKPKPPQTLSGRSLVATLAKLYRSGLLDRWKDAPSNSVADGVYLARDFKNAREEKMSRRFLERAVGCSVVDQIGADNRWWICLDRKDIIQPPLLSAPPRLCGPYSVEEDISSGSWKIRSGTIAARRAKKMKL